jgi:hypothetical protein
MVETTHIELARECESVDLESFVQEFGLHPRRDGTAIEIVAASDVIGQRSPNGWPNGAIRLCRRRWTTAHSH